MTANWAKRSLGEVCVIARGGSPRPIQEFLTDAEDGVNWIKISDATASGKYIFSTAEKIKPAGASRSRVVADGDFLLSNSMSFGRPYIMRTTGCVHDGWLVLSEYQGFFDQDFLYYVLGSPQVFRQFDQLAAGSTVRNLNIELASRAIVPIPPQEEQRRIVAILDEAFASIATAKANVEKELKNVRELYASHLDAVFGQGGKDCREAPLSTFASAISTGPFGSLLHKSDYVSHGVPLVNPINIVDGLIVPDPDKLIDVATSQRLQSYVLCENDIVVGRRGEIGRCAVVEPNQAGWMCGTGCFFIRPLPTVRSAFLANLIRSNQCRKKLERASTGTTMKNLSNVALGQLKVAIPTIEQQDRAIALFDQLSKQRVHLERLYQRKLTAFDELKMSLLHQAFTGRLVRAGREGSGQRFVLETTAPEFTANVIALAHARHERQKREKTFGHVKAQKVLHVVETVGKIDLGRYPMKDAAGPNDFAHMLRAEDWARAQNFFDMTKQSEGYQFKKLSAFEAHMSDTRKVLAPYMRQLESVIDLLVPMDTREAEVFTTVHAAWSNLLIDGADVNDDAIVSAAREGWHAEKLKIQEEKFRAAISLIRQKGLIPDGTAKYVGGQSSLL